MLQILRGHLEKSGLAFCYLDGQTPDRARVVDQFQMHASIPVFLISLKAGGTGLNLTGADTVIHFDPWWNPAIEAQATDRVHRIGQKNVVTSYKLITRNTVEEKILNLQKRKREIIDATVDSEEPLMSGLSMQEIEELLTS
jgi:SNF2 family DNA or RNA helicase